MMAGGKARKEEHQRWSMETFPARDFFFLLSITAGACAVLVVFGLLVPSLAILYASSANLLAFAALMLLVHRGYLELAKYLAVGVLVLTAALMMWSYDGIHDPAVMLFPLAMLFSSLTLNRGAFWITAGSSLMIVAATGYAEVNGYLTTKASHFSPLEDTFALLAMLGMAVAVIDLTLTKLRRSVRNILAEKDRAEAANRAKSEFLTLMSHELRSPLNPIFGYTSLLQEELTDREHQEYLSIIRSSAERLLGLIESVLEYSSLDGSELPLDLDEVDICALCEEIRETCEPLAREKGLRLLTNCVDCGGDEALRYLLLDRSRVERILENLICNVIEETAVAEIHVSVSYHPEKQDCHFSIRTGEPAFRDRDADRIFDLFAAVEDNEKLNGTILGIGMSLSQRLANTMRGELTFRFDEDQAVFDLVIPAEVSRQT